jgi:hypothetical protein
MELPADETERGVNVMFDARHNPVRSFTRGAASSADVQREALLFVKSQQCTRSSARMKWNEADAIASWRKSCAAVSCSAANSAT